MKIVFERQLNRLTLLPAGPEQPMRFVAFNNVDSRSRGRWPDGLYPAEVIVRVGGPDGDDDGKYGPWFVRFGVPGRTGMGIHAGRAEDEDGLKRKGPAHATMGCIRTTSLAMLAIAEMVEREGLPALWVA